MLVTLITDGSGHADTTLQAGSYDVTLTKTGFVAVNYTLLIIAAQTHATFDLARPCMGALGSESGVVETGIAQLVSAFPTGVPPASSTETGLNDVGASVVNTTTWNLSMVIVSINGINPQGTLSPGVTATPAAGATQAIDLTEAQFWAFVQWIGNEGIGTQTSKAYTIAAKTAGKQVIVICEVSYGWQLTVSESTTDETDQVPAATASKTYTKRATGGGGEIWDGWFFNNIYSGNGTTYAASTQQPGTINTLQARFHFP